MANPHQCSKLARGPDFWAKGECRYNPAEQLDTASRVETELVKLRRFSAARLADGTFWEDPLNQSFADHGPPHTNRLFRSSQDRQVVGGGNQSVIPSIATIDGANQIPRRPGGVSSSNWFGRYRKGARSFLDVLKGEEPNKVLTLLQAWKGSSTATFFRCSEARGSQKRHCRRFARLVEAQPMETAISLGPLLVRSPACGGDQPSLPALCARKPAVYTPPFLASLLLDHAMPYGELTGRERVLDPACGSGVFLVGAFRRLVNAWRAKHQWQTPGVETLKSILRNQIVGVELEKGAVNLTAFSLALALCDSLQPKVIWSDLRFDRLRESNLRECDFFQACLSDEKEVKFDIVVGNPPFESRFTEAAKQVNAFRGRAWRRYLTNRSPTSSSTRVFVC